MKRNFWENFKIYTCLKFGKWCFFFLFVKIFDNIVEISKLFTYIHRKIKNNISYHISFIIEQYISLVMVWFVSSTNLVLKSFFFCQKNRNNSWYAAGRWMMDLYFSDKLKHIYDIWFDMSWIEAFLPIKENNERNIIYLLWS